jgi:hypothetical protein
VEIDFMTELLPPSWQQEYSWTTRMDSHGDP